MHNASQNNVGLLGATSLVGECLLSQLKQHDTYVTAFSRQTMQSDDDHVTWRQLDVNKGQEAETISSWLCVAPIWVLPDHFNLLLAHGAQRIIALSSTSRFTKNNSSDPSEQLLAQRLKEYEARFRKWAMANRIDWIILRPTLIYGLGQDKNITEIARFIQRFGFFPLFGAAKGLRQPIHAEDVATVCFNALSCSDIKNQAYNLAGGETLSYRDMVNRVFAASHRTPRLITLPHWIFKLAIRCVCWLPHYRHWTTAMAERMNTDLVFECCDAKQDFNFTPRLFKLEPKDLPSKT
ncbi:MAG: NAD(P)-dependent oxidoreductase [Nitrosomonas sp.]|nr:NAD(P)-dependent oxidoreductase [Nitrosomonas sp.]